MHLFTHLWHVGGAHTFVRERERGTAGDSRCTLGELERGNLSNASECVCMIMRAFTHTCMNARIIMHVCVQLHAFVKERGADNDSKCKFGELERVVCVYVRTHTHTHAFVRERGTDSDNRVKQSDT